MEPRNYISEEMNNYLLSLTPDCWRWNRIHQAIQLLQNEKLHIFIVGTENSVQTELLKFLAPSSGEYQANQYSFDKPPIYYEDTYLCLWKVPSLGRLDFTHSYLASVIASTVYSTCKSSNLFIILLTFDSRRLGISYEEDFIKSLRIDFSGLCNNIDSHIITALSTDRLISQDTRNEFISETNKSLYHNLYLDTEIIPYCPDSRESCLELKAKLLIRSAAIYH